MLEEVVVSWHEVRLNMADEVKLRQIHSTFEKLYVCGALGHYPEEETGPLLLTNTSRHCSFWYIPVICWDFSSGTDSKESACNAEDPGSIPGLGRSPGEGNSNPLQYSCLENPMDRGAWQAIVLGIAKSRAELSNFISFHFISLTC